MQSQFPGCIKITNKADPGRAERIGRKITADGYVSRRFV